MGRCLAGRGFRRTAHHFWNSDRKETWRLTYGRKIQCYAQIGNRTGTVPPAKSAAQLDRLIHERLRLGILSALAAEKSLTFSELKGLLGTRPTAI